MKFGRKIGYAFFCVNFRTLWNELFFYLDTLKIFFSETSNPIYTKFGFEGSWVLTSKICVLRAHPLSKMAAMDSDWLRHFGLLLKNHSMDCHQTCQSVPLMVLQMFYYFLLWLEIQDDHQGVVTFGWDIFDFFSQEPCCMDCHQSCHKCSLMVPQISFITFCCDRKSIGNLRWPPWTNGPLDWRLEIQDGHHGLWLVETFSTSSQEPLLWLSPNLPKTFL